MVPAISIFSLRRVLDSYCYLNPILPVDIEILGLVSHEFNISPIYLLGARPGRVRHFEGIENRMRFRRQIP